MPTQRTYRTASDVDGSTRSVTRSRPARLTVARETDFTPEPFHIAVPGYAYGGIVASIIDCHSTGSAAIFAMQHDGKEVGADPSPRFVTAHLEVDYLLPTPLGTMHLTGRLVELTGRKAVVETELSVDGVVTAKGSAVLVAIPEDRWQSPG